MNTPICDFVRDYAAREPARLHMPGHKGSSVLGVEALDITEIPGADVLYHAEGIILESEKNAASLFGTRRTLYSAEGSSLSIRAMLYLVSLYAASRGEQPSIAAGRNAHKVFITAAALLDIPVQWLYPGDHRDLLSCTVTPEALEAYLSEHKPTAVYITSPDYLGDLADIAALAEICHAHGCLLLVDNAHGAYLHFLPESRHPMALGADLCCDSGHKTLPVLTGGAYLHISRSAPEVLDAWAEQAMALFASTSPSYLILQSLDATNAALAGSFRNELLNACVRWEALKKTLRRAGYALTGQEPLKLTILPKPYGYTGEELSAILEQNNIYAEFADPDYLVLMLPVNCPQTLPERLEAVLCAVPQKAPICTFPPRLCRAEQCISPSQAIRRPWKTVRTNEALGRISASPAVSCPPAIPVVVCGERIDEWAVKAMNYYGIEKINIIE